MLENKPHILIVSNAEDGMKLLRFLERRLEPEFTVSLHKWIRTGQVRVNQKRSKPFFLLAKGDFVRIPPFAQARSITDTGTVSFQTQSMPNSVCVKQKTPVFSVIAEKDGYLVVNKPAGVAVQGGSGMESSIADELKKVYAKSPFIPAPLHRLDKETSGLLFIGTSQSGSSTLSAAFQKNRIEKEYIAVVCGKWPHTSPVLIEDQIRLIKQAGGYERMACLGTSSVRPFFSSNAELMNYLQHGMQKTPDSALLAARLVSVIDEKQKYSVIQVRLFTGKKHQIRVQLSHQGFPILGDRRYGGSSHLPMMLHAMRLSLPPCESWTLLPNWQSPFSDVLKKHQANLDVPWL